LDRAVFSKPVAHRGLHDLKAGLIENSGPAFLAAIEKGYAIECDLQPAADGTPMVFHDEKLDRLVDARKGPLAKLSPKELRATPYRGQDATILSFADFLKLVGGRAPLYVEVKAEKGVPSKIFLAKIANLARTYKGPIALMSFNMDVVVALGRLAPRVPRGLVLGRHQVLKSWLKRAGRASQGTALGRILDDAVDKVSFFAVDVNILKGAAAWRKAGGHDIALYSWTIRSKRQRATAARYADAPIFEGYEA
jgi:glycerophosphoryl diester phosphodiesterase